MTIDELFENAPYSYDYYSSSNCEHNVVVSSYDEAETLAEFFINNSDYVDEDGDILGGYVYDTTDERFSVWVADDCDDYETNIIIHIERN